VARKAEDPVANGIDDGYVVFVIGDYERDGNAGVDQHVRPTRPLG
jgi:hypothetical protein